jgi:endo-1,4-beta-D-glucanase Y
MPFGSHPVAYPGAVIRPSGAWTTLDGAVVAYYRRWKAAFITRPCDGDWLAVRSPDADLPYVGEGQGWGLVITAQMAGADPDAQRQFDGILRWVLAHPSVINRDLHAAEQNHACSSVNGGDSATDSDLDIAYGLLLADTQWGSGGQYNYLDLARRRIAAILRSEVNPSTHLLLAGDWASGGGEGANLSRSSDWMLGHLRAFRAATGDHAWDTVLAAHQRAIATIQERDSPKTGLLPDFVVDGQAHPARGEVLESKHDGAFWWNACRVPWRLGTDAVTTADPWSTAAVQRMNRFAQQVSGGDPRRIRAGYTLAGKPITKDTEPAFIVPFAVAAMVDRDSQRWLDALWGYLTSTEVNAGAYFPATIQLQAMLVLTGNWLIPGTR